MKLTDTILLASCVGFFIIGSHQTMQHGFFASYWIFMLVIGLLGIYKLRKKNRGK
ncbi:MAG: hypothetical protein AB8B61_10285 [Cyclobacteriaceae bacterium]